MMTLVRYPDLKTRKGIPYSRSHLDRLEKRGLFPQRVTISTRTVAWIEEELDQFLAEKVAQRSGPPKAA